ncbi:MAG: hypothetical protein ABI369_06700 [Acetobacteraceae bacterium]
MMFSIDGSSITRSPSVPPSRRSDRSSSVLTGRIRVWLADLFILTDAAIDAARWLH